MGTTVNGSYIAEALGKMKIFKKKRAVMVDRDWMFH
jgi:hypothetical protein